MSLDARLQELDLRGNVRVDSPPFHLSSDALHLQRTSHGLEVEGKGRLAFCKCLGTPLAITFDGAIVAPPGDLVLRQPKLEVLRVPVLWLPYFWLRSPARVGLLAPDLAYRAHDGVFTGGGVHLPWGPSDPASGLDVRGGAYLRGGSAWMVDLRTPSSQTRVRWDHLEQDGLLVDARGAMAHDGQTVAWDVDALRGVRGVAATTELERVARVYDRARVDGQVRDGGWTVGAAVRTTELRGGSLGDSGAIGPVMTVRRADALGGAGDYEVTVSGGAFRSEPSTVAYARGDAGGFVAGRLGDTLASLSLRGAGNVASDGERHGGDGAARARGELSLPFVRAFGADGVPDPFRHRIAPRIGAAALVAQGDRVLAGDIAAARNFGGIGGGAWVADGGVESALGRWGRGDGVSAQVSGGVVGNVNDVEPALRWRAAATFRLLGLGAEGASVLRGHAVLVRTRLGALERIHLSANVAGRAGVDPILARLVTDAPLEPSAGFLAAEGWTGGVRMSIPWSHAIVTRGGIDGDLTEPLLLAARGSLELRDRCECIALRAAGSHRIGREGVDLWLTVDLAPGSPQSQLKSLTP